MLGSVYRLKGFKKDKEMKRWMDNKVTTIINFYGIGYEP